MASQIPGKAIQSGVVGLAVYRAAALQPQTATAAIFTVTGGKVLITSLVGDVVVITPATTNVVKVLTVPTVGTGADWTTAVSTASKEVGTIITLPAAFGGALVVNTAGGAQLGPDPAFVAQPGSISLNTTGSAATGTIKWVLTYVPLDPGAAVVAA